MQDEKQEPSQMRHRLRALLQPPQATGKRWDREAEEEGGDGEETKQKRKRKAKVKG